MGHVREGARGREFEEAIGWLCDAGLASKVARIAKPVNPLLSYEEQHHFKLFVHDVGLLAAMAELDERVLLKSIGVFEEFKGALTEKYVHQQLIASGIERLMYWRQSLERQNWTLWLNMTGRLFPLK